MEMSKDIKIIDNFLPHDVFMKVKNYVFNEDFTWKYSFGITTSKSTNESGQFVNIIYGTSTGIENLEDAQSILYPIQFGLQNKYLIKPEGLIPLRCKLNLNPKESTNSQLGEYHVDIAFSELCPQHKTMIYYLNTNNGYTLFKNPEKKVESIENRIVIFDGDIEHVGYSCTDQNIRCIVNLNFLKHSNAMNPHTNKFIKLK